ncbi:MAG TPA: hypothetical protein VM581_02885 [Magnetospirillaceae bacterium]|nr:hypothetical protein [Magnetospirillaceae bacterium]
MLFGANSPYPPFDLELFWPLLTAGLFVGVIGGHFVWRWLRVRLALRRQKRLTILSKPHKDDIIAKALNEIHRIRQTVESDTLAVDAGGAQISLTARTAFDAIMNHRTVYAAKYEVVARQLNQIEGMLDIGYPVMFSKLSAKNKTAFAQLCDTAVQVVQSCR